MTNEESERLKQYSNKIQTGIVGVLTDDEAEDFQGLIQKWIAENEVTRGKKAVTKEQYAEALYRHQDDVYSIAIKGWQIPILHGLIALAANHPGVKKLGWPSQYFIRQVRWWCREKFREWGFSPEEMESLDKMREDSQGLHH